MAPDTLDTFDKVCMNHRSALRGTVLCLNVTLALLLAVVAVRGGVLASQQQNQPQPPKAANEQRESDAAKAKQRVAQLKKLKLIETLDMNEQTAEKFFVRYNAEQKKVDDAIKALNDAMRELDKLLSQDPKKVAPEQFKPLSDVVLEKQAQMQTAVSERLRSIRSVLDERQYAKFLLFEQKFQEQVRKTLLDVKREEKKAEQPAAVPQKK